MKHRGIAFYSKLRITCLASMGTLILNSNWNTLMDVSKANRTPAPSHDHFVSLTRILPTSSCHYSHRHMQWVKQNTDDRKKRKMVFYHLVAKMKPLCECSTAIQFSDHDIVALDQLSNNLGVEMVNECQNDQPRGFCSPKNFNYWHLRRLRLQLLKS